MKYKIPLFVLASFLILGALLLFVRQVTYRAPQPKPSPDNGLKTFNVKLREQNNSNWEGNATFEDIGNNHFKVTVETSKNTTTPHPVFIQQGKCDDIVEVRYVLVSLVNGRSESVETGSIDQLLGRGPLSLVLHKSEDVLTKPIACGEIVS